MPSRSLTAALVFTALSLACSQPATPEADGNAPKLLVLADTFRIAPDVADLTTVGYMTVSPTGEIVVTQPRDNRIKVFADTGLSRVVGRAGGGPGEFSNLTRIGWNGDTLWTLDPGLRRISRFDHDYAYLGSTKDPSAVSGDGESADSSAGHAEAFVQAVLPGGDLRVAAQFWAAKPPSWAIGLDSGATPFLRVTAEGKVVRRLAVLPVDRCMVRYAAGAAGSGTTQIPFCAHPLDTSWDGGTDLGLLTVTSPDQGDPAYTFTLVLASGDTAFSRTYPYSPVPVSRHAIDSLNALLDSSYAKMPPVLRNARPRPTPASTFPPIDRIVLGRDHTVWLEERTAEPGHHWLMLSPSGEPTARVTLSANVRLLVAEQGTIWGTEENDDGLLGIVRYRVR